ncbi:MAG: DUF3576 domain-containing protein [Candidatus Puniceispirillum sp.]|nr:DUF3576 domain-containing protein [Candidatus Puniceispirillum sp.]
MFKRIFKFIRLRGLLLLTLCTSLLVPACSSLKTTTAETPEKPVSVITGKPGGIKFSDFVQKDRPDVGAIGLPVNALLWRAALDVASFVPLDDVDTFGGSIVTEWHQSTDNPDQRLKLTIFVLGVELRSDAVRVHTYTQKKQGNNWVDSGRDEALARKLEDLILTRARELRAASVSETTQ